MMPSMQLIVIQNGTVVRHDVAPFPPRMLCIKPQKLPPSLHRSNKAKKIQKIRKLSVIHRREKKMAEEAQVIGVHTVDEWTQHLEKGNQSKKLIVIDFTASWCGPCRMIAPVLADLAKKYPNVVFLKVDVDELKTVAQDWAIEAMPTIIYLKEGTIVDKVVGAIKDELVKKVEKWSQAPPPPASSTATA